MSTPNPTKDDGDDDGDGEGPLLEPPDPLMGIKALGIATGLVGGCAGLGVLVVAWVLGVRDVSEISFYSLREGGMVSIKRGLVQGGGKARRVIGSRGHIGCLPMAFSALGDDMVQARP